MFSKLFNTDRFIHSLKTAIACIIGLLLTKIVGFQADQWIVITTVVVMCAQIYVGSVVQRAYLRFLGTLTGCLFASIAIIASGNNVTLDIAIITIALSSFIFSYIATSQENLSYAGTLGAVTTIIILMNQDPNINVAGARFIEISLGVLIAAFVSQFVLPIHARTHLRRTQAITLKQLRDYYTASMINRGIEDKTPQEELDEEIVKSLSKQRQLAKEAVREPLGAFYDPALFMKSLHCEKEILRSMIFMVNALTHFEHVDELISPLPALKTLNESIIQSLTLIVTVIETGEPPKEPQILPSLSSLKEEIQKQTTALAKEELIYMDGFLFSAESLVHSLKKLMLIYRIPLLDKPATASI